MDASDRPHDRVALIFAGGDPIDAATARTLPDGVSIVVAADSGLHHAQALGRPVDAVVGDLDSADPDAVEAASTAGAEVLRHPVDKDATDLELAMIEACDRGARSLVVVGGGGGRFDHLVANVLLLGAERFSDVAVEAAMPGGRVTAIHDRADLRGRPGDLCSLLAVGGAAVGVTTAGLRFPLDREDLEPGSTRGISNELTGSVATVTIEHGTLLAIQPDAGAH